jgi:hypothetical protein
VGRIQGVHEVELLAPKDHHNVPNIAFQETVDIGSKKVFFSFVVLKSIAGMLSKSNSVLHCALGRGIGRVCMCGFVLSPLGSTTFFFSFSFWFCI